MDGGTSQFGLDKSRNHERAWTAALRQFGLDKSRNHERCWRTEECWRGEGEAAMRPAARGEGEAAMRPAACGHAAIAAMRCAAMRGDAGDAAMRRCGTIGLPINERECCRLSSDVPALLPRRRSRSSNSRYDY